MKQTWLRFAARIDALGLRERILVFLCAAAVLIELMNVTLLSPLFDKDAVLSSQIAQDQSQITGMQAEMRSSVANYNRNPDAAKQALLAQAKTQLAQMHASLEDMQKGLVSPDRMTGLLEDILKQNGRLHLISLHTLPAQDVTEPEQGKAPADKAAASADATADAKSASPVASAVYKHGVEIVLEGGYADMVSYMTALEGMPWRLYWGGAKLEVNDSSKLRLTLTLYTLSLDKKWLNI
jgi:MSHA biogenesis protein MshJ